MPKKKSIWEKKRPKSLGKPKPFNKKTKKYKSAKRKADNMFGKRLVLSKTYIFQRW